MPRKILLVSLAVVCAALLTIAFWPRHSQKPAESRQPQITLAEAVTAPAPSPVTATPSESAPLATRAQRFAAWGEAYLGTAEAVRTPDLISKGAELARDRRTELAELIKTDPKAALEAAVPMAVRQRLPQAIQDQLEER